MTPRGQNRGKAPAKKDPTSGGEDGKPNEVNPPLKKAKKKPQDDSAQMTKVNTYTQGELDDSLTGLGQTHLNKYIFQHKVAAQPEAIEYIMRPAAHGFQKRFHVVHCPGVPNLVKDVSFADAVTFLTGLHSFAYEHTMTQTTVNCLDEYARSMYRGARRAVRDFVEKEKGRLNVRTSMRLEFCDSNILRYANVWMRVAQFCSTLSRNVPESLMEQERDRTHFSVFDVALALNAMANALPHLQWLLEPLPLLQPFQ